jgi:hypothetical protein
MPTTPRHERSRVAHAVRYHGPDAPQTLDARRDLAAANLAAYITRVVDQAPPLLPEQRDRLALLLRGSSDVKGAATSEAAAS